MKFQRIVLIHNLAARECEFGLLSGKSLRTPGFNFLETTDSMRHESRRGKDTHACTITQLHHSTCPLSCTSRSLSLVKTITVSPLL
jgi:hypothetical protein